MLRPTAAPALGLVLALVAATGCTATHESAGSPRAGTSARAPQVTLGLTQLIPEEGTDQALLRVTNDGDEPLLVSAVGLDWPGYGPAFTVANDATVEPGRTLDLRTTLPEPACDDRSPDPASGVLDTSAGRVVAPLKDTSQDYLRRLWRTQCDAQVVSEALSLGFAGGWAQEGAGAGATAASTLVLTRRSGDEPIEVRGVDGSVLYDVALDAPLVVGSGASSGRTVVRILPGNRCDEHARGQATAPFDFQVSLRVGDRRATVPFPVSDAAAGAAQRMLDRACGKVTTAD